MLKTLRGPKFGNAKFRTSQYKRFGRYILLIINTLNRLKRVGI